MYTLWPPIGSSDVVRLHEVSAVTFTRKHIWLPILFCGALSVSTVAQVISDPTATATDSVGSTAEVHSNATVAVDPNPSIASATKPVALIKPVPKRPRTTSIFGLQAKASTLGVGFDSSLRISPMANLRIGLSTFSYHATFSADNGMNYSAELRMRSVQMFADIFPLRNAFRISPGALLYNGNRVTADVFVKPGDRFVTDGTVAVSNIKDPISGTASTSLRELRRLS